MSLLRYLAEDTEPGILRAAWAGSLVIAIDLDDALHGRVDMHVSGSLVATFDLQTGLPQTQFILLG